jgi:hypothetical protein
LLNTLVIGKKNKEHIADLERRPYKDDGSIKVKDQRYPPALRRTRSRLSLHVPVRLGRNKARAVIDELHPTSCSNSGLMPQPSNPPEYTDEDSWTLFPNSVGMLKDISIFA